MKSTSTLGQLFRRLTVLTITSYKFKILNNSENCKLGFIWLTFLLARALIARIHSCDAYFAVACKVHTLGSFNRLVNTLCLSSSETVSIKESRQRLLKLFLYLVIFDQIFSLCGFLSAVIPHRLCMYTQRLLSILFYFYPVSGALRQ